MTTSADCPDCGNRLSGGQCRCGYKVKFQEPAIDRRYCAYVSRRLGQCKLYGTVTDTQHGDSDTRYYCSYHRDRSNYQTCEDNLERILSGELTQERGDLHHLLDETLIKLKASNPELFFKPKTEADREEYVSMIMGWIKRKPILKNLPYNKHKNHE